MSKKTVIYLIFGLIILSSCSVQRGGNLVERIRGGYYPYKVKHYVMPGYTEYGTASWYGSKFHGKRTADGEIYNMYDNTAAHKTLPFNTYVRVTNLNNHRQTVVRINDRGPFVGDRIIDLSYAAAKDLDMIKTGTAPVKIVVLSNEQLGYSKKDTNENITQAEEDTNLETANSAETVKTFSVQIGSFRFLPNALKLRDQAAGILSDVHIKKVVISNVVFYRVLVGSFSTRQSAFDYADKYVQPNFSSFCVTDQ